MPMSPLPPAAPSPPARWEQSKGWMWLAGHKMPRSVLKKEKLDKTLGNIICCFAGTRQQIPKAVDLSLELKRQKKQDRGFL